MYEIIDGLISIIAGIYIYLLVTERIKLPKEKEKANNFLKNYSKSIKVLSVLLILFGCSRFLYIV